MARETSHSIRPWLLALLLCLRCNEAPRTASTAAAPSPSPSIVSDVVPLLAPLLARPAASAPPDYEQADLDPDNDRLVALPAPIDGCERRLEQAGVRFERAALAIRTQRLRGGEVLSCGAEQVVTYRQGPGKIRYNVPPLITCRLALALARLEQIVQEEAVRHLGRRVVRVVQMGTYNCRKMVRFDFVSEHSYANALDIRELWLENGERVSVRRHFGALGLPARTAQATFLRSLARRAFDERLFSVVLTPYWDQLHADHFHFDLARYRVDGTRAAVEP